MLKVIGVHYHKGQPVMRVRRCFFGFDEWYQEKATWRRLRDGYVATSYGAVFAPGHSQLENAYQAWKLREAIYATE